MEGWRKKMGNYATVLLDEDRWTKRHFYKYVNGRIRTFDGGKTSFTSNNFDDKDGMYAETTCWLHGKLAEEGETHND